MSNYDKDAILEKAINDIKQGSAEIYFSEDMLGVYFDFEGEEIGLSSDDVSAKYHVYNADDHQFSEYYYRDICELKLRLIEDLETNCFKDIDIGLTEDNADDLRNVINDHTPTSYYFDDGREADSYLGAPMRFDPYAEGLIEDEEDEEEDV